MSKTSWKIGDKGRVAVMAGVSPQRLSNILNRRERATASQAVDLEEAARELGYYIPRNDWVFSIETGNPLFKER